MLSKEGEVWAWLRASAKTDIKGVRAHGGEEPELAGASAEGGVDREP